MTRRRDNGSTPIAAFFSGVATVPDLLARRVELTPTTIAFIHRQSSGWEPVRWAEFDQRCAAVAATLQEGGLGPEARIGILATTSVDWEVCQMAALRCGAVVVGLDPYYPDALLNELIESIDLAALIVDDSATLDRVAKTVQARMRMTFDIASLRSTSGAMTDPAPSHARADAPAVVTLSSGSTGRPQPVVFTHAQVVHAVRCMLETYPTLGADTRLVSWLPLANLFQRMINLCALAKGATSYVVPDPRNVMQVLPIARPHVLIAVPRFCERVHAGVIDRLAGRPVLARLVKRALVLGGMVRQADADGRPVPTPKRLAFLLVDRLILKRLRAVFGGRLRFIVSGSAPMPVWLLDWFGAIGIPILEAYGASENLVPIAANRLELAKAGTVGQTMGDNEVRIAEDGEIQVRGRGVFHVDLAENARLAGAITGDGFLATGDLGSMDADGFLTLAGRKTEVFKNAQGRWISLPLIESALRRVPGVEHAAVVRLDDDGMIGVLAVTHRRELDQDASARDALERRLTDAGRELPAAMQPIGFIVMREGFSPATGELTTNLKLRRGIIAQRLDSAGAVVADIVGASKQPAGIAPVRYL